MTKTDTIPRAENIANGAAALADIGLVSSEKKKADAETSAKLM
ncbi:MAG TPA: hypothetical protein VF493_17090 [Terriglobales bacterium]